jgi:hypothetical protein
MCAAPGARMAHGPATRVALASTLVVFGCGGGPGVAGAPGEARRDDPGTTYESPRPSQPFTFMTPHKGIVLSHMHLRIVYVGDAGGDGAQSYDSFVSWLVASGDYWSLLRQYGVGYGVLDGSERVATTAFFPPAMLASGSFSDSDLDTRVYRFLHRSAGGGTDAGAGGGDEAYLFFLPDNVRVTFSNGEQSCVAFSGYHAMDKGSDPYAIIPWCGRNPVTISHELAEVATDPTPLKGWYADVFGALGEIGDLCNLSVSQPIALWKPTRLWSNADGDCEPH